MTDFPFGDPDGARAELADVMQGFVGFRGHPGWGGIATNPDDRSVRVIIGKKGSGKTVYLRRLQVSTMAEDSVFSQKIQSDIPTTAQVLEFCEICQGEQITEKWRELWRVSLHASLLTLFLYKGYFSDYVSEKHRSQLLQRFEGILPEAKVPHSAYDIISYYISSIRTQSQFKNLVDRREWVELRSVLSDILKECPPVFYYLDAVDEEFAHAPMEWHQCQKGLFYAVMRMLRESGSLGSRFHVAICIRDIVFSSILRSEHAGRYRNTPHICKLNWDTKRTEYFFERKIEQLEDIYFDDPSKPRTIQNFLSLTHIFNESRKIEEEPLSYLTRHTRFLPRDVVELGNTLAQAKLAKMSKTEIDDESWEAVVRSLVSRSARGFAEEQLSVCANQLASHERPVFSARHDYHELYTSSREYIESRAKIFKGIIKDIGTEIFEKQQIEDVRRKWSEELPGGVDPFAILWQNGLVGCRMKEGDAAFHFFNLDDRDDFLLPDGAVNFAFHSCINDAVKLEINSPEPIVEKSVV